MGNEYHSYLCWLDQIRGLGRKSRFALLHAACEMSLFSGTGPGGGEDSGRSDAGMGIIAEPKDFSRSGDYPESSIFMKTDNMSFGAKILYTAPETQLQFICGEAFSSQKRGTKAARMILAARKTEPERIGEQLLCKGISFSCFPENDFPERLRVIPDPPFGIYFRGQMPAAGFHRSHCTGYGIGKSESGDSVFGCSESGGFVYGEIESGGSEKTRLAKTGLFRGEPVAAVIGARLASGYGREQARRFSRRMAQRGITIISGMARGIDGIAQRAALDAGGKSYAVLGCGVDICYPEENRDLYDRLLAEGGILSEYAPGVPPEAKLFPQRNRIISGLSDLVLVIEARKKSGTLITVDMALEQGREVYALPGRVSDGLSDGCNRLIRQGAGIATCPEDILEFFFGTGEEQNTGRKVSFGTVETEETEKIEKIEKTEASKEPEKCNKKEKTEASEAPVESEETKKTEETEESLEGSPVFEEKQTDNPGSLEQVILSVLSYEDEKHLEQIVEEVNLKAPNLQADLFEITTCLLRLKIIGKTEELSTGYYHKLSS